ncbi:MAG: hypothetical protein KAY65_00490 [Planctomycetes bacterium]|nr:hypothetical protein [Planctomycetota bacterium]
MEKNKKKTTERYIRLTYDILAIRGIGLGEKTLLALIHSFGAKGCYQKNETLAKQFRLSPSTISRMIRRIRKYIYIKNPKGYYRTMWSRSHQDVREALANMPKSAKDGKPPGPGGGGTAESGPQLRQNCSGQLSRTAQDPAQKCSGHCVKSAIRVKHKRRTYNNKSNREINKDTTASASPLPAGGQAPPMLTAQKQADAAEIKKFKATFGNGHGAGWAPPAGAKTREKARRQINALLKPRPAVTKAAAGQHNPRKRLSPQQIKRRVKEQIKRLRKTEELRARDGPKSRPTNKSQNYP